MNKKNCSSCKKDTCGSGSCKKDTCVNCEKETQYDIDCHIDYRFHYIEGAGQLCKECYEKIYEGSSK